MQGIGIEKKGMTTPQSTSRSPELDGSSRELSSSFASLSVAAKPSSTSATVPSCSSFNLLQTSTTAATQESSTPSSKHFFPFFLLPLELREQIYSYLLISPESLSLTYPSSSFSPHRHHPHTACPLSFHRVAYPPYNKSTTLNSTRLYAEILRVNRTTYTEGIHFLYSRNDFILHSHTRLFLDVISERHRLLLSRLTIDWSVREEYQTGFKKTFSILSSLHKHPQSSLKSVILRLDSDEKFGMLSCIKSHLSPWHYDLDNIVRIKLSGKRGSGTWLQHVFNCDGVCSHHLTISRPPVPRFPPLPSKLFYLPLSVRQRIYSYLIPQNQTLDLHQHLSEITLTYPPILPSFASYLTSPALRTAFTTSFALLTTCQTISREVSSFIYTRNVIRVYSDSLHIFNLLGSYNFSHLKNVEIFCDLIEEELSETEIYNKAYSSNTPRTKTLGAALNLYSPVYDNLSTKRRKMKIYKPVSWSMNSTRYLRGILDRLGKNGMLEKLVVKMVIPAELEKASMEEEGEGYKEIVNVVREFKNVYAGIDVKVVYVHHSYDAGRDVEVEI